MSLTSEDLLTFRQAANEFPGRRKVGAATLHRWRLQGVRGGHKLETCLIGGIRYTSKQAIDRFIQAVNSADSVVRGQESPVDDAAPSGKIPCSPCGAGSEGDLR